MKKILCFWMLCFFGLSAQAQDFEWTYIVSRNIKTPFHLQKEGYMSYSSLPLEKQLADKYFIPLLQKWVSLYGKNHQTVLIGKIELNERRRAILYAIYPFQDDTRFLGATYFIATFEADGKGINVESLTSYNRSNIGKPGGISIVSEGELYAVYVAEWEAGEFSKKLVAKFDKKGIFVK